ncbi:AMP-binding protein [Pseudomonas sp. Gutcm_11s]|uniref:AMP-binding protein n=1 Tax=Pseudomonas sp. Gutcm_11s TaxID=3026088 RepID=UPI002361E5EC|nr:AMP-binding protein [Pseudomonas sp. Gutcm_11s]MDD0841452.1 AMP-binding protein [Pseudomonas sp. Gutcm_11s]
MTNPSPQTVYELLVAATQQAPQALALAFIDDLDEVALSYRLSHEQLLSKIHKTVQMMRKLTGKSRPVVSLLLPNIPQAQTLLWAAETAGVANPLNPLLNEEALLQLMSKAQTDIVFALGPLHGSELWDKAVSVASRLPNRPLCVSVFSPAGAMHYDSEVNRYKDVPLVGEDAPTPKDIAAYFHTGGTTGTPKLACHTHENQTTAAMAVIRSMQLTGADIAINGLPIFHVAGAIVNSLAVLGAGGQLVLPTVSGFRNPEVIRQHWRLIQTLRVTISSGIPTSMASMLDAPLEGADISSLRFLLTGGAPVPLKLHELALEKLDRQLYQAYGMTESSGVIALPNLAIPAVWGSVGHVSSPVEVSIESGQICVRSPMVFPGYLGLDSPVTPDGWLKTGDLGHLDEAGNLFITGRAKDLIIRSGHNIDPALIEGCLEEHPAVSMAAAVGMPDEYAGELPVVFVQLREGMSVSRDDLQAYAMEHIAERPACPKKIIILDALPVTAVGKVFKPKLREIATDLLLEELLVPRLGRIGIESRHTENGQLVVKLWRVPQSEALWCSEQVRRINLVVDELAVG